MDEIVLQKQKFCDDPSIPHEGFVILQDGGGFFHASLNGESIYQERYKKVQHFQNGWAWVQVEDGQWKMINKHGAQVHGPKNLIIK